jgi:hypothetical protein
MSTDSMNIKIVIASVAAVALAIVGMYAAYCIHEQQEHHRLKRALAAKVEVCGQRLVSTSEAAARWLVCAGEQSNAQPVSGITPDELKQWLDTEEAQGTQAISVTPTATFSTGKP